MFKMISKKGKKAKPIPIHEAEEAADVVSEEDEAEAKRQLMEFLGGGSEGKDLRTMMLYGDVNEERAGDMVAGFLMLHGSRKEGEDVDNSIRFYISTYGGSADDMFSIYDIMRMVKKDCDIETIGMGKIMSAGTLILASGSKGHRKIMKNCRVMIHSVSAGNLGTIHNLENELEEIQHLQDMYVNALAEETHMTKRQIRKLLDQKVNVYLTAEEAVAYGLADEVI
jgi:ATP-dependent Clp protease protease subunit